MMNQGLSDMEVTLQKDSFAGALKFVNPIVGKIVEDKMKVLIQRVGDKVRVSAGGLNSSIMVVDVETSNIVGECKAFVDGEELFANLRAFSSSELRFKLDSANSQIRLMSGKHNIGITCEIIKDYVGSSNVDEDEAKVLRYRNGVIEELQRAERDVQSGGMFMLSQEDFVGMAKALEICPYTVNGEKCVQLRMFVENRFVEKEIQSGNPVTVEEAFAVIEGLGSEKYRMNMIRKDGYHIAFAPGAQEISVILNTNVLAKVSSAIEGVKSNNVFKDEAVIISRGASEMCISIGSAKFLCSLPNYEIQSDREYFNFDYKWKVDINVKEFKSVMELLSRRLDGASKNSIVEVRNETIIKPFEKCIRFVGTSAKGEPVDLAVDYEMAANFMDFNVEKVEFNAPRKFIKEALGCIDSKSKKVTLGIHLYTYQGKMKGPDGKFVRDENNNFVLGPQRGSLLSISDPGKGVYQRMQVEGK